MYTIAALWTAVHHQLPVTYVVCNNGGYRILQQSLRGYRSGEDQDRPFPHLRFTDPELRFDRIAEAFGASARRIERPEDLGPALRAAIASGGPSLVDVVLDRTP